MCNSSLAEKIAIYSLDLCLFQPRFRWAGILDYDREPVIQQKFNT